MGEIKNVDQIIKQRTSIRTYQKESLRDVDKAALSEILKSETTVPFGGRARFELVELLNLDWREMRKFGTYGFIRGARSFVVGIMHRGKRDAHDFGYLFEKMILEATAAGLGTCWIGAALHRTAIADTLELGPDEFIPAMTPVGYPTVKRGLSEKMVRRGVKGDKRVPFEQNFFDRGFGNSLSLDSAGSYGLPLESVRLAPSAGNKQPWRIVVSEDRTRVDFYLERDRFYTNSVKGADLQGIDMGIAMCHFELVCKQYDLDGKWVELPEDKLEINKSYVYCVSWISA